MNRIGENRKTSTPSIAKPVEPKPDPVDVSGLVSFYSTKYEVMLYGPTLEDCWRQQDEMDALRGGKRTLTRGLLG